MRSFILLISIFAISYCNAQVVGIGTATPNPSAQLDITAANRGLLIPRVNLTSPTDAASIPSPATALLVYNTNSNTGQMPDGTGFYHWNGSSWLKLLTGGSGVGASWLTTGNSGTGATNFLGTVDNQALRFRVNNTGAGIITNTGNNVGLGYQSLLNNTGTSNTAVGALTLPNVTGGANTALGHQTLWLNTTGHGNVGVGGVALVNNITGNYNTVVGTNAGFLNTHGYSNVAVGAAALFSNGVGTNLVAIGDSALLNNVGVKGFPDQGFYNTAVGSKALRDKVSGSFNVALGHLALLSNYGGSSNIAIGQYAMGAMTFGNQNIAIGQGAFSGATNGNDNIVIGSSAVPYSSTGSRNIVMGTSGLNQNTSGSNNTAIGYYAMSNNTSGYSNIAIGPYALYNKHGQNNTIAIGDSALFTMDNVFGNTAVGSKALFSNNANYCTGVGYGALYSATNQRNTAMGYLAGYNYNHGSYCTFFGAYTDANTSGYTNSMALGDAAIISASNQVRIGDVGVNSIGGQVGWTTFSDARFKTHLQEDIKGLTFIMKLKPVSYQYDINAINRFLKVNDHEKQTNAQGQERYSGFLAQQVEQAAKESGFNFSGVDKPKNANDHYGLRYSDFVVPLVKAIQEQQLLIEKLTKQVEQREIPTNVGKQQTIIKSLQQQNGDLQKRLSALEEAIKPPAPKGELF